MPEGGTPHPIDIRRTADLPTAMALAREARKEISAEPAEPLALWGAYEGDQMVGTVSLGASEGRPIVQTIAVASAWRDRGIGSHLLAALEEEALRRGVTTIWATARAPDFFLRMGYQAVPGGAERDELLADCRGCAQLGTTCSPEAVRKTLA